MKYGETLEQRLWSLGVFVQKKGRNMCFWTRGTLLSCHNHSACVFVRVCVIGLEQAGMTDVQEPAGYWQCFCVFVFVSTPSVFTFPFMLASSALLLPPQQAR